MGDGHPRAPRLHTPLPAAYLDPYPSQPPPPSPPLPPLLRSYTGMPLSLPLSAPTGCPVLSALTNIKNAMSVMLPIDVDDEEAIKNVLGLSTSDAKELSFTTCSFNPLERVWSGLDDERGSGSGDDTGATTEAQLLKRFMKVQVQIITVTDHIATVVGFASDEMYVTAANAVVVEAGKQIFEAATNVQGSRRKLQSSLLEFDTALMVAAAAIDTQVSSNPSLGTPPSPLLENPNPDPNPDPKPKPNPNPKPNQVSLSPALASTLATTTAAAAQFASNETEAIDYSDPIPALSKACHTRLEPQTSRQGPRRRWYSRV
jgi:hypothetical protein